MDAYGSDAVDAIRRASPTHVALRWPHVPLDVTICNNLFRGCATERVKEAAGMLVSVTLRLMLDV